MTEPDLTVPRKNGTPHSIGELRIELIARSQTDASTWRLFFEISGIQPIPRGYNRFHLSLQGAHCISRAALHWRHEVKGGLWHRQLLRLSGDTRASELVFFPQSVATCAISIDTLRSDAAPSSLSFEPVPRVRAILSLGVAVYRLMRARGLSPFEIADKVRRYLRLLGRHGIGNKLTRYHQEHSPGRPEYADWLDVHEHPLALIDLQRSVETQPARCSVAVVCDAACPDPEMLEATIDSVRAQAFCGWKLFVRHPDSGVVEPIEPDDRNTASHAQPGPENDSSPVTPFECDFLLMVRAGDTLTTHALAEFVTTAQSSQHFKLWYPDCDEHVGGTRDNPSFKSDWNRELFYSGNYVGDTLFIDARFARAKLGVDACTAACDAQALLLRVVELGEEARIGHIPKVLVSAGRRHPPEWVCGPRIRALERHFDARKLRVSIEPAPCAGALRLRYALPDRLPSVHIIIPTRDQPTLLRQCVESILENTTYPEFEISIVDNDSRQRTTLAYLDTVRAHDRISIIEYGRPFNFSAINNYAVSRSDADVIAFVNDDVEVIEGDWLGEMVSFALQPDVGCVGAKLLYDDHSVQHAGVLCGVGNVAAHAHRHFKEDEPGYCNRLQLTQEYSAVTAACMVMRAEVFKQVGGFDEKNLSVAYNDVDLCLKIRRAGYRHIYTPYAVLYHHESVSRGKDVTRGKRKRYASERAFMWETWTEQLLNDPYYNPNLTRSKEDFSLKA